MGIETTIIDLIFAMAFIFGFLALFWGYHSRKKTVLKLFGYSNYFTFEILSPARKSKMINRLVKDFKITGKQVLFQDGEHYYLVMDDRLFLRNNTPCGLYRFGNPIPLNIFDHADPEIAVYDDDHKTMVNEKMSASELRSAITSTVVKDLNKFTFNRMEMITIIIAIVGIIFNIVVIYEVVNINGEIGTLINELNQILSHLPTVAGAH